MESLVPIPSRGRTFVEKRRVRLTDVDPRGRLRLDAVARFLQEIAIDDVDETGWGAPDHLWFVRRMRMDVLEPFLAARAVELVTWCSGLATVAAGRRWSLSGDRGGRIEVDSVWIHPRRRPTPGADHALRSLRRGRRQPARFRPETTEGRNHARTRFPPRPSTLSNTAKGRARVVPRRGFAVLSVLDTCAGVGGKRRSAARCSTLPPARSTPLSNRIRAGSVA